MGRNLPVLMAAQGFAQSGPTVVILLGGIVGTTIAPDPGFATFPVATLIIGVALFSIPAAMFMARFGRKRGFLTGTAIGTCAALGAAASISAGSFWAFAFCTLFVGAHVSFAQQYRFAVTESVPVHRAPFAISMVMLAGIVAAIVGPETAKRAKDLVEVEYAGSFLGLAVLLACGFVVLLLYQNSQMDDAQANGEQRPLGEIVRLPAFALALGASAAGYGIMSFVMTATPVSMHVERAMSLEETTFVIQSHIAAMYLPSLASGFLTQKLGPTRIIWCGLALMFACVVIGMVDQSLMHYWFALVLLGVGWNFLFLGGTTLLTTTYRPAERFKVQATNDFSIFSLQAAGALSSGAVIHALGWDAVMWLSLPWLVLLVPVLFWYRRGQGEAAQAAG